VLSDNTIEYDWGTSLWQEVAVTDGRRLILWHGCDVYCAGSDNMPPHLTLESSVRTVHLSELLDQTLYTEYAVGEDGSRSLDFVPKVTSRARSGADATADELWGGSRAPVGRE